MRNILVPALSIIFCLIFFTQSHAQWSHRTMMHDDIERDYWIYLPEGYNPDNPASLLVTLHGMGDSAKNFKNIGFQSIADTANIILLVPNALVFHCFIPILDGMRTWNSYAGAFGIHPNKGVDDVGFLNAIVDTASANYAIDPCRIYICGFSMGGFMTERMALVSNSRFAAFAVAAGAIGSLMEPPFQPRRAVPVIHLCGTNDLKVGIEEPSLPGWGTGVDSTLRFWIKNNYCDTIPIRDTLSSLIQGHKVERIIYPHGDDDADVVFYKVEGLAHAWLKPFYNKMIWQYLSKHTHCSSPTSVEAEKVDYELHIFPNPARDVLTISAETKFNKVQIIDNLGRLIRTYKDTSTNKFTLNINELLPGKYYVKIYAEEMLASKKFIKI